MFPVGSVSLKTPDQYKLRGGLELMFFCLSHSGWGGLKSAYTKKFKICLIFGKIVNLFVQSSFSYCGINLQVFHQPLFLLPWEAQPLSFFHWKVSWRAAHFFILNPRIILEIFRKRWVRKKKRCRMTGGCGTCRRGTCYLFISSSFICSFINYFSSKLPHVTVDCFTQVSLSTMFFFLTMPGTFWGLIFLPRDWTHAPGSESVKSWPLDCQGSPHKVFRCLFWRHEGPISINNINDALTLYSFAPQKALLYLKPSCTGAKALYNNPLVFMSARFFQDPSQVF